MRQVEPLGAVDISVTLVGPRLRSENLTVCPSRPGAAAAYICTRQGNARIKGGRLVRRAAEGFRGRCDPSCHTQYSDDMGDSRCGVDGSAALAALAMPEPAWIPSMRGVLRGFSLYHCLSCRAVELSALCRSTSGWPPPCLLMPPVDADSARPVRTYIVYSRTAVFEALLLRSCLFSLTSSLFRRVGLRCSWTRYSAVAIRSAQP